MSDYKRATRTCDLNSMRPELAQAIRAHVEKYNLGAVLDEVSACIETTSVLAKKGMFGKEKIIYTAAVLTKSWLLWANSGTDVTPHALSARLNQITVQDYAQSSFAKLIPDSGVVVNGLQTDTSKAGSTFIGLEENEAGKSFKDRLVVAVQEASGV